MEELLTGKQLVINTFKMGIFLIRHIDVIDDDDHDCCMTNDELYPEEALTSRNTTN